MDRRLSLALALPVLATLLAAPLMAQDAGGKKPGAEAGKQAKGGHGDDKSDPNRAAGILRGTRLLESQVATAEGKDVGKFVDIVLDPSDGRIQYAVLDANAFTDTKDKLVAVPADALQGDNEPARVKLVGIDKAQLAAAPSFGKTEWPKDGDREFVGKVWKAYDRKPYWDDKAPTGFATVRLSAMLKSSLTTAKGEDLGKIENAAVDVAHGRVLYVIVHPSASVKAGEKAGEKGTDPNKGADAAMGRRIAVPWASVAKGAAAGKPVIDMDAAHFMTAPGFDSGKWPDMTDAKWAADVAAFFSGAAK